MKDVALLNIKINARKDFFKGPFSSIAELKKAYEQVRNLEFFLGDFTLLSSGELVRGFEKGLHTRVREIDENLGGREYHLHDMGHAGILYISKKGKKLVTEYYPTNSDGIPIQTLNGLYDGLPNQEIETKIKAVKQEIHKRGYYEILTRANENIAKSNDLKLKLLENTYKREILVA